MNSQRALPVSPGRRRRPEASSRLALEGKHMGAWSTPSPAAWRARRGTMGPSCTDGAGFRRPGPHRSPRRQRTDPCRGSYDHDGPRRSARIRAADGEGQRPPHFIHAPSRQRLPEGRSGQRLGLRLGSHRMAKLDLGRVKPPKSRVIDRSGSVTSDAVRSPRASWGLALKLWIPPRHWSGPSLSPRGALRPWRRRWSIGPNP